MRLLLPAMLLALPFLAMPVQAEPKQAPSAAKLDPRDPNAVVCRRLEVTGSLVRKVRTCKTNAEWMAIGDQHNRVADEIINHSRGGMNGAN